jgi:hypothetical protein
MSTLEAVLAGLGAAVALVVALAAAAYAGRRLSLKGLRRTWRRRRRRAYAHPPLEDRLPPPAPPARDDSDVAEELLTALAKATPAVESSADAREPIAVAAATNGSEATPLLRADATNGVDLLKAKRARPLPLKEKEGAGRGAGRDAAILKEKLQSQAQRRRREATSLKAKLDRREDSAKLSSRSATSTKPKPAPHAPPEKEAPGRSAERRGPPAPVGAAAAECRIALSRGHLTSHFYATTTLWGRGQDAVLAASPEFHWAKATAPPPDRPDVRSAYELLLGELEASGWERNGRGSEWFSLRFRRREGREWGFGN